VPSGIPISKVMVSARADFPAELYEETVSVGVSPSATARLASAYYRSLRRDLEEPSDARGGDPPSAVTPAEGWLHPSISFAAYQRARGCSLDEAARAQALDLLAQPRQIGRLDHVCASPTPSSWVDFGVATLRGDVESTAGNCELRLAESAAGAADRVERAIGLLREAWPEAAVEVGLLARCVVHLAGGSFRSATLRGTFGAIYIRSDYLDNEVTAFETVLHEVGHHSMFLRNSFVKLVRNGSQLVHHPLRPDPRPISGTLHAAHVLARMAEGLDRWSRLPHASPLVIERRDENLRRFGATVRALNESAEWTDAGTCYFASLRQWLDRLANR
jgi:HEXXH motif-containing protein